MMHKQPSISTTASAILLSSFFFFSLFLIPGGTVQAQQRTLNFEAGTKVLGASDGELPFYLYTKELGTIDPQSTNSLSYFSAQSRLYERDDFYIAGDITAVGRLSEDNSIHLPIYQFSVNWHDFQFDAGRFARPVTLNKQNLTTGSMIESDNAIPFNRIMISNPVYKSVPFTNGVVEYKGMFSHGWLSDERFTKDVFIHQKDLFARVNLDKFTLHGGLSHNVMWGGQNERFGQLPATFNDFIKVVTGDAGGNDAPSTEQQNRLGNTLLYFVFGLDYQFDEFELSLTRSFLKEDTGSKDTRSPWDGIFGVNFDFQEKPFAGIIDHVLYEYYNTIRMQSKDEEARGRGNFYNNGVYRTGWTSRGMVIGSSLAFFDEERGKVTNNMIIGHHLAFQGHITNRLEFITKATYTRNYGNFTDHRNDVPFDGVSDPQARKFFFERSNFREDQYSVLLGTSYALSGENRWLINTSVSWDIGELYSNNVGFSLGIQWNNIFNY